jgi:nucleotide-binding universal stress UspA family protein
MTSASTDVSVTASRADDDDNAPVLICYDGSKHAAEAIDFAASLLPGARALVVTAWTPILEAITAVTLGPAPPISDPVDADARQQRTAEELAHDGARRADRAGMRAEGIAVRAAGRVWEAIERTARRHAARMIVCGTRGSGPVSAVVDTVSGALVHRAARPVLVVPSSQAVIDRLRDPLDQ